MNCHSTRLVLDLFVEDRLTDSFRARVEAHLKACPACAREAAALRPNPITAPQAPTGLKDRLRQALSQAPAPAATGAPTPVLSADARAAVWILVAFAVALFWLHAATPHETSQRPVASPAAPWRTP